MDDVYEKRYEELGLNFAKALFCFHMKRLIWFFFVMDNHDKMSRSIIDNYLIEKQLQMHFHSHTVTHMPTHYVYIHLKKNEKDIWLGTVVVFHVLTRIYMNFSYIICIRDSENDIIRRVTSLDALTWYINIPSGRLFNVRLFILQQMWRYFFIFHFFFSCRMTPSVFFLSLSLSLVKKKQNLLWREIEKQTKLKDAL